MSCPHKHVEEDAVATAVKATPIIWRNLDERQQTAEFEKHLHREFAPGESEWIDPVSRRNFLKIMGASVALAGAAGCIKYPEEAIVPYVQPPTDAELPGRPMFYATAMPFDGHAWPMIATAHEGRPTKVDGNPDHPASLGSSTAIGQASILQMYDPERSQTVTYAAQVTDWSTFQVEILKEMAKFKTTGGTGLYFLSTPSSSPTLAKQIADFSKAYPNAKWHVWEPCANHGARQASIAAFGKAVNTIYRFDQASRILSLDSNFCVDEQGSLIYARQFINGRRLRRPKVDGKDQPVSREIIDADWQNPTYVENGNATMNRLYMVETNYTATGAMADHRLALKPSQIEDFARALAAALGVAGVTAPAGVDREFLQPVIDDLRQAGASALVIPGRNQPPAVHVLAHAINQQLGAVGKTVVYTDPVDGNAVDHVESIRQLAADMAAGQVDALFILDGNPVYDAPADLNFTDLLNSKVRLKVRYGLYYDETSFYCHWQLPASHYLECWSDARAYDGTVATIQPLILPLYQSKSRHEIMALLAGDFTSTAQEIIRTYWQSQHSGSDFADYWQTTLCKGVVPDSTFKSVDVKLNADAMNGAKPQAVKSGALEVSLPADSAIWDGTWSTNGWLQELPRAITKLVWDNAALISTATAKRLGVDSEGLLQLNYMDGENKEQSMTVGVWVVPGHADDCITLNLGYGRKNVNAIGGVEPMENLGFNAYPLRKTSNLNFTTVTAVAAKGRYPLSSTQLHQNPEGRDLVRFYSGTEFAEMKAEYPEQEGYVPGIENNQKNVRLSLYPEFDYAHGHRWGMVVDDNACVGCNACVMACQSENNIPVVGKDQVARYREMHWLRIDSWHFGDESNPITVFEPVMCQMCEHAPCELVCPVNATTHSAEGINEMTYNRCVGTRYCSNNCPYKVRRFNFLRFNDYYTPSLKMMRNPLVTVRERGVMEKCTYCIQRLDITRIDVKRAQVALDTTTDPDEKKRQGDTITELMMGLQTACQQSCPTEAIFFGDMNYQRPDQKPVRINELKNQQQSFGLLTEYNTQPRTSYMNRFRNPNPALEATPLQYPTAADIAG
jgi:MoCo/4Fe-4S cofactor protein with predicted Tat translocation signal